MITANYQALKDGIWKAALRSGRNPQNIRLIAVTKYVGIEEVRQAAELGLKDFGENRVQEGAEKIAAFPDLHWHFIGHLQSNKVKQVLPNYILIHSLDRVSLAQALQRCAEKNDKMANVLVQVNVAGEDSKYGLTPAELAYFLTEMKSYDRLRIHGLMTIAPYLDDSEKVRPIFQELRSLRDENRTPERQLPELSMGMTNDYEVAVEEGATMIRVGSALFQ